MKLHGKKPAIQGLPREVTCLDSLMAEMLNCVPDTTLHHTGESLKNTHFQAGSQGQALMIHQFMSGAALAVGPEVNQYFIFSFLGNGNDAQAAEHELEFLDHLRLAKQAFIRMKNCNITPATQQISLRVTKF